MAAARAEVDEAAWMVAWSEKRTMLLKQASAHMLEHNADDEPRTNATLGLAFMRVTYFTVHM